eukprot:TRINITY_DN28652_c0_g1_i1.p1 TRINITY_DN28652_c0_g1~~TRINITY_DN28652_c0_g1_i1.p1  ORF type:complete len:150 (-),score=12.84 TRINITY_DN28652_c0_g1_i1:53-502(-)
MQQILFLCIQPKKTQISTRTFNNQSLSINVSSFSYLLQIRKRRVSNASLKRNLNCITKPYYYFKQWAIIPLINSLLYNLNEEIVQGHELENTDINPYNEFECNPLQEITHWQSFEDIKNLYMKIENDSKINKGNITYQMLINQNNCNSL